MSKGLQTKNDKAWEKLFDRYNIARVLAESGKFEISSKEINQFREARLMTKFDHQSNLPEVFRKYGLSILPVTRGSYMIAEFDAYKPFKFDTTLPVSYVNLPEHIQSIDFENITSEASAINCAYVSGIFSDFLGEDDLCPTVSGRMSSKTFDFQINNKNSPMNMSISNSQIEIDGGFEGLNSLSLIEAKNTVSSDFLVRQLYYPFRLWENKVDKVVRPIFLIYTNGIFDLYEYKFEDVSSYNSLVLIKQRRYSIERLGIHLEEINNILKACNKVSEPNVPFPQADSFERVINLCELLNDHEILSKEVVTTNYDFDKRQTNYYTDAGRYLGLIEKCNNEGVKYFLTAEGKALFKLSLRERQLKFVDLILQHAVFARTLEKYFEKLEAPTRMEVVEIMKVLPLHNIDKESSTINRRASTALSWVNWILGLSN